MVTESLVDALSRPAAYAHAPESVTRLETHISVLFFAGDRVYKLKKPLDLGFLDFTRRERRRHFCEEEVQLNRRLAPDVYLGVRPVTRGPGNDDVRVGGGGEVVDYVVEMKRLSLHRMMDQRLDRGEIDNEAINELAELLADFHENAETGGEVDDFGRPDAVAKVVLENIDQLAAWNSAHDEVLPATLIGFLRERLEAFLDEHRELLARRVESGRIRDGHGDLHSANICFEESGIVIYDCIEFAPAFRCGDVALDLAFLAMDLDLRCFRGFSSYLLYRYQALANDPECGRLMDFYKTHRALVRAKVGVLGSEMPDDTVLEAALRYLHLAVSYWLPPALILTCGLPASGKSWIAARVARPFEAVVLRSDLIRRRLRRESGEEQGLDRGLYTSVLTDKTYELMLRDARQRSSEGRTVIVDATFLTRERRASFVELAQQLDAPFVVLHAECSEETTRKRLALRGDDPDEPSEADLEVYFHLRERQEPLDEIPERAVIVVGESDRPGDVTNELLERVIAQARRPACP